MKETTLYRLHSFIQGNLLTGGRGPGGQMILTLHSYSPQLLFAQSGPQPTALIERGTLWEGTYLK